MFITMRKIFHQVRVFLQTYYSITIPIFFVFALPIVIWPLLSAILRSVSLSAIKYFDTILSALVSVCYPLGALSLSLCTYAWQNEKKTSIRHVLISLNSVIGPAVSTYIAQAILMIVPLGVPLVLLFAFHVSGPIRDIYLPFLANALAWLFYFFTWPLFIINKIASMKNALASIKLSLRNIPLIALSLVPFLCWALVFQILASKSIPLVKAFLIPVGYIAALPLAIVEMTAYGELFPKSIIAKG